jgi:hypothetical protein
MRKSILVALACALSAGPLNAQMRRPASAPRTWASVYGLMYTGMGSFDDPDTDSHWGFEDNSFGLGAALLRQLGQSLQLGLDVSLARPNYESEPLEMSTTEPETGSASVATALLQGRFAAGGASELAFYLTGGIGTIAYKLEHLDGWNSDFALRGGTGLEYRFRPTGGVFLEWGRIWGYHEKEGVSGGRVSHSMLKLGGRLGF